MFTVEELAEDAAAELDIIEDVREECKKFGKVTNVILYDKEEEGVMTVRFGDATAAASCVRAFHGRWYDKRQVQAQVADGRERFKKSKKHEADDKDDEARLEEFSNFIEAD